MKKLFKKILCVALAAVTVFSYASCNKEEGETEQSVVPANAANHQFTYTETDEWLVQNGKSDYVIVLPQVSSQEIGYAKDELIRYFKEATGITLTSMVDDGTVHNENNKYISFGDTTLWETSELTIDRSILGEDGVRILTKDKTIFFQGNTGKAILYGVYDFLNMHFNFDTLNKECYVIDTGVKDLKLMDYNVTDIPDIPMRARGGALYAANTDTNEVMYSYRMRYTDAYWKRSLPIYAGDEKTGGASDHNSLECISPDLYLESDPEFFSTKNPRGQLCYTARGDEEKFDRMTTIAAEKIIQSLIFNPREQYPLYNAVQIGIEDNYDFCECDACLATQQKYEGAISASIIIFLNSVGTKVNAWMALPENEPYKRENLQYMFFAYYSTLKPPYKWSEEEGKFIAADDKVMPVEGVNIIPFCAFSGFSYGDPLDSVSNATLYEWAQIWGKFFPGSWSWDYGCFFRDYFCFFDSYNFFADYYAFLYELGFEFTLVQHHSSQRGSEAAFFSLSTYVTSKLSWNSALNMNDLINAYMVGVYKDAAPYMMQLFNECRMWFNKTFEEESWGASIGGNNPTGTLKYWDIGFVTKTFGILDEAYEAIEVYKRDEKTYNLLKRYIDLEWLFPAKVAINNFESEFTASEFKEIKTKFKRVCNEHQMIALNEFDSLDSFLSTL